MEEEVTTVVEGGLREPDGMEDLAEEEVVVVAVLAVVSPEAVADSVAEAAADPGKRFQGFADSSLGFRLYLAYFCASLKSVHEKG